MNARLADPEDAHVERPKAKPPYGCPKCGETDFIRGGRHEADGDTVWQSCDCLACAAEWTEVYTFSGWDYD